MKSRAFNFQAHANITLHWHIFKEGVADLFHLGEGASEIALWCCLHALKSLTNVDFQFMNHFFIFVPMPVTNAQTTSYNKIRIDSPGFVFCQKSIFRELFPSFPSTHFQRGGMQNSMVLFTHCSRRCKERKEEEDTTQWPDLDAYNFPFLKNVHFSTQLTVKCFFGNAFEA